MAGQSTTLAIKIVSDASGAAKGFDQAESRAAKFAGALQKAAVPAAAVGLALVGAGKAAIQSASDQQQAVGGVQAVYGTYAAGVIKSSQEAAKAVGLSGTAYDTLAAQIGGQLKAAGVPIDQIGKQTDDLIKRGADLATTYGGSTADAVDSLSAAFRGEADSSEKYNLRLSQSQVQAELVARGQDKLKGAALAAAKVQATAALVYKQSGDAAGQFAVQTNSLAEQQQIAGAQFDNAKAKLGTALLPVMTTAAAQAAKLAGFIADNARVFGILAGVLAGIALVVGIVSAAMAAYSAVQTIASGVTKVFTAVQKALNASFLTNPVFLIIAGILLLVGAFILAYKHSETFRNVVNAVLNAVKVAAQAVASFFASVFQVAFAAVSAYVRTYIAIVVAVVGGIRTAAVAVAHAAVAVFHAAVTGIQLAWSVGVALVMAYIRAVVAVASAVASTAKALFLDAIRGIRSAWSTGVDAVKAIIAGVKAKATEVAGGVKRDLVGAFDLVAGKARSISSVLTAPFRSVAGYIQTAIGKVQDLIGWLGRIASHIPHISLPGLPGFLGQASGAGVFRAVPAGSGAVVGATIRPDRLYAAAGGGSSDLALAGTRSGVGTTIVINGALDPVAVARQIKTILTSDSRRAGGVVIQRRN